MKIPGFIKALATMVLLMLSPSYACGETLEVTAGEIAKGKLISPDVTTLTLTGTVNAADLHHIALTCRSLQKLDIGAISIEAYHGDKAVASNLREFPAGVLPAYALSGMNATEIILPESIRAIADGALLSASVEHITIPQSVTSIGQGAFADCRKLQSVKLGDGVKSIGHSAFSDCTALLSLEAGSSLTEIGDRAFAGCGKLESFIITSENSGLTSIGKEAFCHTGLLTLDLSSCKKLKQIGDRAFIGCTALEELLLPDELSSLGEGVLFGCTILKTFNLPQSVNEMPLMALTGDAAISDATGLLHDGVKGIGAYAFSGINTVSAIILPAGLERIGTGAFEGWEALASVEADKLESVPALGEAVWAGVDQANASLRVHTDLAQDFASADQWREFRIITDDESGLTEVTDAPLLPKVQARFANSILELKSDCGIERVAVHDTDGRQLFSAKGKGDTQVQFSTGLLTGKLYIISLNLSDGRKIAVKLHNI